MFREQELAVVGGGDSAVEEATYLTKFASKVYLIHRRDELRASRIMQERAFNNDKVEFVWNTTVTDVLGDEKITGLRLKNTQNGEEREMPVGGLFLAIGHTPITGFLDGQLEHGREGLHPSSRRATRSYTAVPGSSRPATWRTRSTARRSRPRAWAAGRDRRRTLARGGRH